MERSMSDREEHSPLPKTGEHLTRDEGSEVKAAVHRLETKVDAEQFVRSEVQIAARELRDQADEHQRQVRRRIWSTTGAIVALLGVSSVWGLVQVGQYIQKNAEAVRARVEKEFETPRIRDLMMEVASDEARGLLQQEVQPKLEALNNQINEQMVRARDQTTERLGSFETAIREVEEGSQEQYRQLVAGLDATREEAERLTGILSGQINDQQKLHDLLFTVERAEYGSARAYAELRQIAQETTERAEIAARRVVAIERELSLYRRAPRVLIGGITITSRGKTGSSGEFSTAELFEVLRDEAARDSLRHRLMADIRGRPKPEIASAALAILGSSDYLPTLAATCGIVREVFGERARFMDVEGWKRFLSKETE